jgi:aminoglycoside phosphotransferase (APT) family kinase protein
MDVLRFGGPWRGFTGSSSRAKVWGMSEHDEDWGAVAAHLAAHGMRLSGAPQRFAGGLANRNYLITLDGWPAVLRRPPAGPLPPGAHVMAREHRILSRLADALPVAPRSLHLCEDVAVMGAAFQILEYRPGRVVRAILPDDLADRGAALSETMLTTLAAIHAVDTSALGLDGLGRPDGFLGRAVSGWRRRGLAVADAPTTIVLEELGAWLEAHAVPDGPPTLLHNDFKLDNLILDEVTLAPTAVVDWDQGTRGDPLFDLATLLSYWTEVTDPPAMHALQQMPTGAPGFLTREEAAARYAALTGRDLSGFRFHRVLGVLKLGVIFLQLHALHKTGATTDPRYAAFGAVGEGVLAFGRDVAGGVVF